MLTQVLLLHLLRAGGLLISVFALIFGLAFGFAEGLGVLAGGLLAALDGAALIYIVGSMLNPLKSVATKSVLTMALILKLAGVAVLLWALLSVFHLPGLGVTVGLGVGFMAVVIGASRGSTSVAGQAAIAESEAQIRQEMGDTDPDSR